jgi:hypothetical protein
MIKKKYFRQKNGEKLAVLTQNKAKLCKNLVWRKTPNCQKSQKIVIVTSTPRYIDDARNKPRKSLLLINNLLIVVY